MKKTKLQRVDSDLFAPLSDSELNVTGAALDNYTLDFCHVNGEIVDHYAYPDAAIAV